MQQLAVPVWAEIEVKKSRFIGLLFSVKNRDEARARLAEVRAQYPGAGHYCTVLITEGDSGLDDDGEPSGTAAKPMYSVLAHKGLVNVFAVVVRYWGGIKLGAGGLTRAYGQAVSEALRDARFIPVENWSELTVTVDFAGEAMLRHCCEQNGVSVLSADYGAAVNLRLKLKAAELAAFKLRLTDRLRGQLLFADE